MVKNPEQGPDKDARSENLLGKDFELWLQGREKQKGFLETRAHLDAAQELSDLMDKMKLGTSEKQLTASQKSPEKSSGSSKMPGSESFTPIADTREPGSEGKNPALGLIESIWSLPKALGLMGGDLVNLAMHPGKSWKNTRESLRDEGDTYIV